MILWQRMNLLQYDVELCRLTFWQLWYMIKNYDVKCTLRPMSYRKGPNIQSSGNSAVAAGAEAVVASVGSFFISQCNLDFQCHRQGVVIIIRKQIYYRIWICYNINTCVPVVILNFILDHHDHCHFAPLRNQQLVAKDVSRAPSMSGWESQKSAQNLWHFHPSCLGDPGPRCCHWLWKRWIWEIGCGRRMDKLPRLAWPLSSWLHFLPGGQRCGRFINGDLPVWEFWDLERWDALRTLLQGTTDCYYEEKKNTITS